MEGQHCSISAGEYKPPLCALCSKELEFGVNGTAHFQCIIEKIVRDEVLKVLKEKGLIE